MCLPTGRPQTVACHQPKKNAPIFGAQIMWGANVGLYLIADSVMHRLFSLNNNSIPPNATNPTCSTSQVPPSFTSHPHVTYLHIHSQRLSLYSFHPVIIWCASCHATAPRRQPPRVAAASTGPHASPKCHVTRSHVPWSKVAIFGMVIPPFNRNPYNGAL